jgi:hypothetical protein
MQAIHLLHSLQEKAKKIRDAKTKRKMPSKKKSLSERGVVACEQ